MTENMQEPFPEPAPATAAARRPVANRWWQRPIFHLGLVIALGAGLYLHTLHAPFVLDDFSCIKDNPAIRSFDYFLDFDKVRELAIWEDIKHNFALRTVTYLTFALNYRFGGFNETGYHLVNIAIHLLNALLVYLLARVTLGRVAIPWSSPYLARLVPLLTALLFVAHPLQTQAVTYINQRFTCLLALFYLSALLLYIAARRVERAAVRWLCYGGALLTTLLAMKTQESAFTLPAMLGLYDWLFLEGKPRQRWLYVAPFLLTMLVIPVTLLDLTAAAGGSGARSQIEQSVNLVNFSGISQWDYLNTQFGVIATYLRLFLLPVGQNLIPAYPPAESFFALRTIAAFLLLVLLLGGAAWHALHAVRSGRRAAGLLVAFGVLWFFVSIAMSSSIIPLQAMLLEYRVYLPSFGIFFAVAVCLMRAVDRGWWPRRVVLGAALIAIGLLSAATYARNEMYNDKIRLLSDVLDKNPDALPARVDLSVAYLNRQRYDEAIAEISKILQTIPTDVNMMVNLGCSLQATGRHAEAMATFRQALDLNSDNPYARGNLGITYHQMGLIEQAEAELQAALAADPHFGAARQELAILYEEEGRLAEALEQYRALQRSFPENRYVAAKVRMLQGE